MTETAELLISRVGAQGDGVAETAHGPVFVPFTLAGERVRAQVDGGNGRLEDVLEPSAMRTSPRCRHFGICGGCKLQHMQEAAYLAWKRDQVVAAFKARGIEARVAEVLPCRGQRRRAVLSARQTAGGVLLGYHREASHELVDLAECPVLHSGIVAAFGKLRTLTSPLLSRSGEIRLTATWSQAGLGVAIEQITAKLTPELRARIAAAATTAGFARLSIAGDPVCETIVPFLRLGSAEVPLPPGTFLQAVAESEEDMARLVLEAAGKSKSVADLFCGLGAFTMRLAGQARVFAADSDKAAIGALNAGLRKARGLKPVEAKVRDLFREPLSATELKDFDCAVFDPPRAGAEAQARMIARAKLKTVVAVSCNPATLARDARILIDGGYTLEGVAPVDQFQHSPHIEAVAVFRR